LTDESGQVLRLDVSVGKVEKIADSEAEFRDVLEDPQKRDEWFGETDERGFVAKGLAPDAVAAIKEEIFPEIESHGAAVVHWAECPILSQA
jgi:hypothetical protein